MAGSDLLFSEGPASLPLDIVLGYEPGVQLLFVDSPAANPFNIVFGGVSGGTVEESVVTLDATFAEVTFNAFVVPPTIVYIDGSFDDLSLASVIREVYEEELTGSFAAMTFAAQTIYVSDTERPTVANRVAPYARRNSLSALQDARHAEASTAPVTNGMPWRTADSVNAAVSDLTTVYRHSEIHAIGAFGDARSVQAHAQARFADMLREMRPAQTSRWRDGRQASDQAQSLFRELSQIARPNIISASRAAAPMLRGWASKSRRAEALQGYWESLWRAGINPPAGRSTITSPPPPPGTPCYPIPDGNAVYLVFKDAPGGSDLVFVCDGHSAPSNPGTIIVPIKRTYMVINDIQLIRVDGNIALDATALSLNIDQDSWTWSFNATLPASSLRNLQPGAAGDQVQLRAIINGTPYLLIVESVARDRQFGSSSITVSGRGHNAVLSTPYTQLMTFTNAEASTAQQLMLDVLTVNGVSIGWDIDWQISDWIVPAGAWNHQGDYMTAINAIAGAAGAFVQPDPVSQILRILPRYPVAPWDWYSATTVPDFQLPSAAMRKESISWATQPDYNSVYVSGSTAGGILAHVTRAGTAGDLVAQMITDALITDSVAARQRALPVLAYTGAIQDYSLSLPILQETGIINPGKIIAYVDDGVTVVGLVKGVSISSQLPSATQVIEVEVHG